MIEEQWAGIEGYPDYAVSNYGQVKSVRFDRLLKPRYNSYGHGRVVLYADRVAHEFYIHRLVARAFIDGYRDDLAVKHFNEENNDNDVYNLRFRQGQRMGQLVKTPIPPSGARHIMVVETGMVFRTVIDCANYIGGQTSSIYRVLRGERPSHLGYTFRFVEESS